MDQRRWYPCWCCWRFLWPSPLLLMDKQLEKMANAEEKLTTLTNIAVGVTSNSVPTDYLGIGDSIALFIRATITLSF